MNTFSMHNVISVAFEPVQYLSAGRTGQDSYYVKLIVTQQVPYSEESIRTEIILHSDEPLLLGIPN
jgi:hypothetical protein